MGDSAHRRGGLGTWGREEPFPKHTWILRDRLLRSGHTKLIHARKQGDQAGYALLIGIKISEVQVPSKNLRRETS